jgi:hypothetical protein
MMSFILLPRWWSSSVAKDRYAWIVPSLLQASQALEKLMESLQIVMWQGVRRSRRAPMYRLM